MEANKPITYECIKCGRKLVESEKGKGRTVSLYCCGENMIKNRIKGSVKKKTAIKTKKK